MTNLMVDIETLGTKPGCSILAIAAVPFSNSIDNVSTENFYEKIDRASCTALGLIEDAATISWWDKQSEEARAEAFSGIESITDVLSHFHEYCSGFGSKLKVWGNGASFDIPILEAAFRLEGLQIPWLYYNSLCYRTLKNLYPAIKFIEPRTKHNALEDAIAQAKHATRIFQFARIGKN